VTPPAGGDGRGGNDPIRVLFLMIHMAMGGSERLVFNLVRNLDRRRFEPSIAWFTPDRPLREFENLQVPLFHVPKEGRIDWRAMARLASLIRTHRIDLVNAHHFMPFVYAYYGAKIANRTRLIYTEHSEADVLAATGRWKWIGRQLLRSSDGTIGISETVSRAVGSHFSADPRHIHTIENGVDLGMFGGASASRHDLRRQLGLAGNDVAFGHVANFRRNKNHLFLLRAFQELVRRRPEAKLLLVGKGYDGDAENSEPEVRRFIDTHRLGGSVSLLGYRPDVHELLAALDVFCLVSYKEGLPLSLIEAMATGLPVIGSDIGAIREVVQPDGNGLLAAPDDVPALTGALDRLAGDVSLRRRLGDAGRRLAREKYSLARCVQQTQDLFLSAVPGRRVTLDAQPSPAA
jgi:glycosyltransferase involved in cell wall biosynthesis